MRWVTHQVGALGAGLLLHLPLAGLAACVVGGILPDVFDQKLAGLFRNRQKAFNNIHRGFTHCIFARREASASTRSARP